MISIQQEHNAPHHHSEKSIETGSEDFNKISELLELAVTYHQAGQMEEAEHLYKTILDADMHHPQANHNMGVMALTAERFDLALDFLKTALESDPIQHQFWVSYVGALIKADCHDLARNVLIQGIGFGLEGDDVDNLVNQLQAHFQALGDQGKQKPSETLRQSLDSIKYLSQVRKECRRQLRQNQNQPDVLMNLGRIELKLGNTVSAIKCLNQSIRIDIDQAQAWSLLGIAYTQVNQLEKAIAACQKSIALCPASPDAYVNLGNAHRAYKQYEMAIQSYEKAIALAPENADVFVNLGHVCKEQLNYVSAAACYQQALTINPNDYEVQYTCGLALSEFKAYQEAINHFSQALVLKPDDPSVLNARFLAYLNLNQFQQARQDAEKLVKVSPSSDAYLNLGVILERTGCWKESLQIYNQAIEKYPAYAALYANRGLVLAGMRRQEEAIQNYDHAIALDPNWGNAYWNKSLLCLQRGDYAQGWQLYEWRWKTILKDYRREFPQPLWLGDASIRGKRLLVTSEQGFGDFIQFCRYIPLVEAMGAKVTLEVPKPLQAVISTMHAGFTMIEAGNVLPETDYYCPIMSLPAALKTEFSTIPNNIPYLFAENEKKKRWLNKLGAKTRPRIGLVFSGSTKHQNDHNRSIAFERLIPLAALPVEFHLLQKEVRESDLSVLQNFSNVQLHQDELMDYSDTAALIQTMDLVISVDTSVAHLAASIGKGCWIMLPYTPDFRWMLDREDSPWYPNVRLFRQPVFDDWDSVVDQIKQELGKIFAI